MRAVDHVTKCMLCMVVIDHMMGLPIVLCLTEITVILKSEIKKIGMV